MKITFIGSGNVATHLARELEDKGHFICEIFSRSIENAKVLRSKLFDAKVTNSLNFSKSEAELFILAVPDDAIEDVLSNIDLPNNTILVHTAGSIPIDTLNFPDFEEKNIDIGVFYPLMTFTKNKPITFGEIPLCIEAATEQTEQILVKLGQQISNIVYIVDSAERKTLHLAAIFVNNFTNHLLGLAQYYVVKNDLEFRLLKPIINETIAKAFKAEDIHDVQTGPAVRGDQKVMKSHISMLAAEPQMEKIYRVMSESIFNYFN